MSGQHCSAGFAPLAPKVSRKKGPAGKRGRRALRKVEQDERPARRVVVKDLPHTLR